MKILANSYKNRKDLEAYIKAEYGKTTDIKPDHSIEGTREELKILSLTDRNKIYGIQCKIIDKPTLNKTVNKIDRGKIYKSILK